MASCPLAPYGVEERQDRQNNNDINKKREKQKGEKKIPIGDDSPLVVFSVSLHDLL